MVEMDVVDGQESLDVEVELEQESQSICNKRKKDINIRLLEIFFEDGTG